MSLSVTLNHQVVQQLESLPALKQYELLPVLLRELIIDEAIAPIHCTPAEVEQAQQQFCQQYNLTTDVERRNWLIENGFKEDEFEAVATRSHRVELFKRRNWASSLNSYFLKRKTDLDRAVFSIIRTTELEIAQELFYRIEEGEQSFADAARLYSEGPEACTGGITGPIELSQPPRPLVKILTSSQVGELWPPFRLGQWYVIVRLEELLPAQLDDLMRRRLLSELFESWLQEQVRYHLLDEAAISLRAS